MTHQQNKAKEFKIKLDHLCEQYGVLAIGYYFVEVRDCNKKSKFIPVEHLRIVGNLPKDAVSDLGELCVSHAKNSRLKINKEIGLNETGLQKL